MDFLSQESFKADLAAGTTNLKRHITPILEAGRHLTIMADAAIDWVALHEVAL
jgi:hypothetical protein